MSKSCMVAQNNFSRELNMATFDKDENDKDYITNVKIVLDTNTSKEVSDYIINNNISYVILVGKQSKVLKEIENNLKEKEIEIEWR